MQLKYEFTDNEVKLLESALIELSNHADVETLDKIEELVEYLQKQIREQV